VITANRQWHDAELALKWLGTATTDGTLGLPSTSGPRRIHNNLRWLAENQFIALTKRPGLTAAIQLLDPQDAGIFLEDPRNNIPYVTMPIEF
jgi:hypothetical protein